jgi:hypothetical protein
MKIHWIKYLKVLIFAVFISSCSGAFAPTAKPQLWTSYPSQFIVGNTYVLKAHEKINGNIVGIGTNLIIEDGALVQGNVSLVGSTFDLSGRIAGDLNVIAGSSLIENSAIITGNINQVFQNTDIASKAVILGEINSYSFPSAASGKVGSKIVNLMEWLRPTSIIALQIGQILGLLVLSLIGIYLFKKPTENVVSAIAANLPASWGAGLLTIITIPFIAIILVITICLSPIGILLIISLFVSILWGLVAVSSLIGQKIIDWLKLDWSIEAATLLGAFLLGVFSSLINFIPCFGFLINLMIASIGIGGILISRFGRISG